MNKDKKVEDKFRVNATHNHEHHSNRVRCPAKGTDHPVVYLSLDVEGSVVCPYCGTELKKDR